MLSVLFGAATKMTDDLSQGVRRGNRAVYERGRINGRAPLGYIKIRDLPGFRGAGKVVPDPERFEHVKRVWKPSNIRRCLLLRVRRRGVVLPHRPR